MARNMPSLLESAELCCHAKQTGKDLQTKKRTRCWRTLEENIGLYLMGERGVEEEFLMESDTRRICKSVCVVIV